MTYMSNNCFTDILYSYGQLSGGLHIVARKITLYSIQNPLTPAILGPAGEVDDVPLLKDQVTWVAFVVAI